jgi:hypothetical protein
MEYEGSIGFVSGKMKNLFANFYVLGLFMAKKHYLREKQIPSVTRRCKTKFVSSLQPPPRVFWANLMHFILRRTIDAQFSSLAVRRNKNKNEKKSVDFK